MKQISRIAVGAALILLIPTILILLALWHWKPGVFVIGALLLLGGAGLMYGITIKKLLNNRAYLYGVVLALAAVFLLAWMNAAVDGILGDNPANMMYFGVLLVGCIGALIADAEPGGMSWALFATAFAIVLVPAIALAIDTPAFTNGVAKVFGLHAVFAAVFVASGLFFRKAATIEKKSIF